MPGEVRRFSQRARRGREALLVGQEGSRCPPGGTVGVGRFSLRAGKGQNALPEGREGPEGPSRERRGVRRTSRGSGGVGRGWEALPAGSSLEALPRAGSGWDALPVGLKRLGDSSRGLGLVGRPSRRSRNGPEAFRKSGVGWEALPKFQEALGGLLEGQVGSGVSPIGLGGFGRPSW